VQRNNKKLNLIQQKEKQKNLILESSRAKNRISAECAANYILSPAPRAFVLNVSSQQLCNLPVMRPLKPKESESFIS
jgi:hypothetical protein